MRKATKKELEWMRKVSKLLSNPPSDRLGLFTIGDCNLFVYDKAFDSEIDEIQTRKEYDFCQAVNELDVGLGNIESDILIHSTSG